MRFDETRDFLQAKELQQEEEDQLRAMHKMRKERWPHSSPDDVDNFARNTISKYALENMPDVDDERMDEDDMCGDGRVSLSRDGIEARRQYLRKSEEPRVWQLDPREDFKVNKMKTKKKVDQVEIDRIYRERLLEKGPLNSLHGLNTPMTITPDMLADDDEEEEGEGVGKDNSEQYMQQGGAGTCQAAAEEVKAAAEAMIVEDEDGEEILQGVERINNRALHPLPVDEDTDEEDEDHGATEEDEAGILSDDSWEEIPRQVSTNSSVQETTERLVKVSVDEDNLSTSSSTSSFLLTTDAASTPNP